MCHPFKNVMSLAGSNLAYHLSVGEPMGFADLDAAPSLAFSVFSIDIDVDEPAVGNIVIQRK
jgi:hypothetical protein